MVHVEIQLWMIPEMKERCIYYQSKMITEQLSSGKDYSQIKRVVSIIITDFNLLTGDENYHNQFRYRTEDGMEFTNLTEINTLELLKLPPNTDNSELWYWTKFITSDNEEVLDMIAEKSPQMKKAVGVLKELSTDERTRLLFEEREKTRRDIASMLGGARLEGKLEVARKLKELGMSVDIIIKATLLTQEEIESL